MQAGWFTNWLIFNDPFTFLAFFVFFTVTLASNKRAPFDLAEAESELVGGFHTEYSGMRWSFFFLAEYASMFFVSMLGILLFMGGWWTGIAPIDQAIGNALGGYPLRVLGFLVLMVKAGILVTVQIWVRWTLPRLRIDQVMTTCLKYLVPISCFLFLGATVWPLALTGALGRPTLLPGEPMGARVARLLIRWELIPWSGRRVVWRGGSDGNAHFRDLRPRGCGAAIGVVVSQNVVRMAFWLIVSLGSVAGLFFLLHADFVGAAQLLIYVGGTVVLLIFGVMLTASGPMLRIPSAPGEVVVGGLAGLAVLGVLVFATIGVDWSANREKLASKTGAAAGHSFRAAGEGQSVRKLGAAFLGLRFDQDLKTGNRSLSTGYLLPFEIISVHLLVVLVGASYLARTKRRKPVIADQKNPAGLNS